MSAAAPHLHLPPGSGAGAAMARLDAAHCPLGPPAMWPAELIRAANMMLEARVEIVLFWGPDFVAFYNDAYAPTIGAKHPAALGRPARENWGELWDDLQPLLARVLTEGESVSARDRPFYLERSGVGETTYFDISYSPLRDDGGAILGVLCVVTETTQRVLAQRRAVAERERLAGMFEQAPSFMALLSEPGHVFEFANHAYQELVGDRAVIGQPIASALPEIAAQGFVELFDRVAADRQPYAGRQIPISLRRQDGREDRRLLDFVVQPILDPAGAVTALFVEGNDVTNRVRAEEQLAVTESTLHLAAETAELGTWDLDLTTDRLIWSDRTKALFGISPDVACSMADFYAGLHPDDLAATSDAFAAAIDPARRATYDVEYRTIGKEDGVVRWVAARGRGIFGEAGTCVRAVGTVLDVTKRRQTEELLRESERRFRSLADSAPALIWMCDEQGALVFANRWHERFFGRPVDELLGRGWRAILHPEDEADFAAAFDAAFAARAPFSRDVRVIARGGEARWLHAEARPREVEGRFAGYVGCDVDITEAHLAAETLERSVTERTQELAATNRQLSTQIEERERVEATLRQMQRLEAIGQLTSGVAHDFNNLLTVVLGNVDLVARAAAKAGLDDKTTARLGYMRTAAERGATLTGQLLAFSRRQRLEARAIDLNDTVAGMRDLLQSSMGGSVRLETRPGDDLWPALVDPTQIELIILNLAINARDAMEVGGTLTVATANVTLGRPVRPEEPPPGDYVMIAVTDTGSGMSADVRDRAFEPFFTTKPVGKGSGLGLPQVFGFAKQSGGGVAIETTPGEGSTIKVYLPRSEERRRPPSDAHDEPVGGVSAEVRGRRVLVVDDDPPVREITASMLRNMGADVLEAGSGGAALELLDDGGRDVDLMVVDFAMPGMNGAELAAATAARRPRLPVLFATGYADLRAIASVSEERIVQKPFRGDELQRKVALLLGRADVG